MQSHTRRADCLRLAEFQLDKVAFLHGDEYSTDHSIGTAQVVPGYHARTLVAEAYKKTGPFKSQLHWIISRHKFAQAVAVSRLRMSEESATSGIVSEKNIKYIFNIFLIFQYLIILINILSYY